MYANERGCIIYFECSDVRMHPAMEDIPKNESEYETATFCT